MHQFPLVLDADKQFSAERFSALQTERNAKRWHGKFDFDFAARNGWIVHLKKEGLSNAEVAQYLNLSKQRVGQVLKSLAQGAKSADIQQSPPESNLKVSRHDDPI